MTHGVRVGSSDRFWLVDWIQLYEDSGQFWIFVNEVVVILLS